MSTNTTSLKNRPSIMSMSARGVSTTGTSNTAVHSARPFRPCNDCTCSPGLLSRQGRRSLTFYKRMESSRRKKEGSNQQPTSDSASVYSSDTLCKTSREINTTGRLLALRKLMQKHDLGCYIVPSEDEHQSEYVSLADQRRAFISGFSGSAGVACITRDVLNFNNDDHVGKSILSTDGRYFNQALQELDYNWTLVRQGVDSVTWQDWCIKESAEMSLALGGKDVKIGVDPKLISYEQVTLFEKQINEMNNENDSKVSLVAIEENLIDSIWGKFEVVPEKPKNDLLLLSYDFHGEEFKAKRSRVLEKLKGSDKELKTTFIVVALDEICWFLNLRGSDIDYNPVFNAYLLINDDAETTLFTDDPYDEAISKYFKDNGITVKPYMEIWKYLDNYTQAICSKANEKHQILLSDNSSWKLVRSVSGTPYKTIHSPIDSFKSVKNQFEINNARKSQIKDAVCLVQYFAWLENQLVDKEILIDEYKAAEKLTEIRKTQKNFKGNSFETISSTGANAAVIHYSPPKEGSTMINPSKIYLCDSGSQFLEGTTDITRTLHFTTPSQEEINNYTLVLKGNLALERLVIPEGTTGFSIDAIARQFLWSHGLDYRHGTGHGIGSFLNVHEGPIGIGFKPHLVNYALRPGNIISNEPGYYKDGEYGIRIENDMLVKEAKNLKFGDRKFLKFENITKVPYCKRLINVGLLSDEEKVQINKYHDRIWNELVQFIQPQSISYKWLQRETSPLQ
ncbi:hypothetical protein KAFR_0F04380 [Kazachstania africana CBS 2517]|uniref:Xaa-Pro aminopeptidase n=1 Tax=Kazachstania africana (strain ATCC 22294 / BCRC 22015 / CBS 2517 / CECT 1963 / NBRC 1671 / NRRL Y-8276) TaxID=1071382 RepID=H2AXD3_KAZAF|nr:hypothetical protein KAFR_0F04380 [Kazachstania africana CBS 2517]CCF59033.1 hypothetical protein KAFR_0F04380 [Kazachstania africana CBS 2517]